MSDRRFVDTNILVYAHDSTAGAKHERAKTLVERLWQERTGAISTQILQELAMNLRRKVAAPLSVKEVQEIISDYLTWQVIVNDGAAILEALDFEQRYKISFWDALIVQAAHTAGAQVLYTEDLADGQRYGNVMVENPLIDRVHEAQVP
jgi:predicted nucleic acid-binding protein